MDFQSRWTLFLNVEGTMVDIAQCGDAGVVPKQLPRVLGRLHAKVNGACALISGRDLSYLDRRLRWRGKDAAGCGGAQFRAGGFMSSPAPAEELIVAAAERLMWSIRKIRHALVEIETRSVALHYGAAGIDHVRAFEIVSLAARESRGALRIVPLSGGYRLRPIESGKDGVIARFMKQPVYRNRIPLFAGNDVTDEAGFQEVNYRGGISISVGSRTPTSAKYRFSDAGEFRQWLEILVADRVVNLPGSWARL